MLPKWKLGFDHVDLFFEIIAKQGNQQTQLKQLVLASVLCTQPSNHGKHKLRQFIVRPILLADSQSTLCLQEWWHVLCGVVNGVSQLPPTNMFRVCRVLNDYQIVDNTSLRLTTFCCCIYLMSYSGTDINRLMLKCFQLY